MVLCMCFSKSPEVKYECPGDELGPLKAANHKASVDRQCQPVSSFSTAHNFDPAVAIMPWQISATSISPDTTTFR